MQNYGHLINRLLGEINAVEYCIEPIIGSRIRDDVVVTHRREADRLGSLHGRKRLKATITGIAWDLIKTLSDTGESDPSSTGNDVREPFNMTPESLFHLDMLLSFSEYYNKSVNFGLSRVLSFNFILVKLHSAKGVKKVFYDRTSI